MISCGARLAPFDIQELREIMLYDEMELDMIGDQRTAMFVIISDTDDTFNFVVAIMYTQLFNLLCDKADDEHGGRLPYHVRLLLDEFSNIGQIPKFDKLIATIRSREISASIILQSQSQLKTIYTDAAETITGTCDTVLFQTFDSSAHRSGCYLWCLMCCKDQWFPFPGFLIFLSVWNFPFRPGKERCHSCL